MKIEINEKFKQAFELMENSESHILITGRAGTGKSTLLDYFRNNTKKNIVVLAPTGVAAVNVKGVTIHSFFKFRPDITVSKVKKARDSKIYRNLDAIVIDEISMVRADLLDCIDKFMRINGKDKNKPFGGVQMILFGDLYQLPPVVKNFEKNIFKGFYKSHYFFDAKAFENLEFEFVELEKIYRQKDQKFIEILNAVRNNSLTNEQLKEINKRYLPNFQPESNDFYIILTSTKEIADKINKENMDKIKGNFYYYQGIVKGSFPESYLPLEKELAVKIGSQVMLINNDNLGRWINGSIGKIVEIERNEDGNDVISIELLDKKIVQITPYTWNIYDIFFDDSTQSIESRVVGSFIQYPIKPAWAITIHKSQGKTFDKVIIDIGSGAFAHGQIYVALSRCTSLNGIVLKKPIRKEDVMVDWKIVNFVSRLKRMNYGNEKDEDIILMIENAIKNDKQIKIIYLKKNDQVIERVVKPVKVGEMVYMGKRYKGLLCYDSKNLKTFRLDRIMKVKYN
ncbi:MAG: AAA family ATPase [candidate division WOR-3 bacterium]